MVKLMLYKKVHRQFVKEFRVGREFKYSNKIFKITSKPYIDYSEGYIRIKKCEGTVSGGWSLIVINDDGYGLYIGKRLDKDNIEWLN